MDNEKISIIMGVFNCADTLPDAIESILAQTYTEWELIMCDDCSTDDTYRVAEKYKNKYPEKIILIRNDVNSRLAFSLNHCLKYATGKYVARMDGDDLSVPERFEKQIKFLKENPNVDLVGTYMRRFDGNVFVDIVTVPTKPNKFTMRNTVPFAHATIMTYKRVYDELNGYTVAKETARAEDADLWFKFFAADFKGETIPEPLYFVRENMNAIKRRTFRSRWDALKVVRKGHKLLKYPKWWILEPMLKTLLKSFSPVWIVNIFRRIQSKKK